MLIINFSFSLIIYASWDVSLSSSINLRLFILVGYSQIRIGDLKDIIDASELLVQ